MALSHGIGSETQKPLAIVIIGGLISATMLTLDRSADVIFVVRTRRGQVPARKVKLKHASGLVLFVGLGINLQNGPFFAIFIQIRGERKVTLFQLVNAVAIVFHRFQIIRRFSSLDVGELD